MLTARGLFCAGDLVERRFPFHNVHHSAKQKIIRDVCVYASNRIEGTLDVNESPQSFAVSQKIILGKTFQ